MSYAAQNLRDLMGLARLLRRFAHENTHDSHQDLFLSTAVALEDRAHLLAVSPDASAVLDEERDSALHAPVDCRV